MNAIKRKTWVLLALCAALLLAPMMARGSAEDAIIVAEGDTKTITSSPDYNPYIVRGGTLNVAANGVARGAITVESGTLNVMDGGNARGAITVKSGTLNVMGGEKGGGNARGDITVDGGTLNVMGGGNA